MSIQAFRYDGAALVSCEHVGPRMLTLAGQLGGNLVGHPRGLAVLYLPLDECATGDEELAEHHLDALRAVLEAGSGR